MLTLVVHFYPKPNQIKPYFLVKVRIYLLMWLEVHKYNVLIVHHSATVQDLRNRLESQQVDRRLRYLSSFFLLDGHETTDKDFARF